MADLIAIGFPDEMAAEAAADEAQVCGANPIRCQPDGARPAVRPDDLA
jgi:hypothetical protein